MRVARLLARLLVAAAAALLLTAVFDPAAGLASTQPGFSTEPRVVEHPSVGAPKLVGLRAGRHPGFDRVVFQLDGPIPSSYSVRYLPVVAWTAPGSRCRSAATPSSRWWSGPRPMTRTAGRCVPRPGCGPTSRPARGQRPRLL
jgi:hypothetical protein